MNTARKMMLALALSMTATAATPASANPVTMFFRVFLKPAPIADEPSWSPAGIEAADRKSRTG